MFKRIKYFIEYTVIQQTKFFFQRAIRGYSDDEVWGLDTAILNFTLPRLKALRNTTHSFPTDVYNEDADDHGHSKWLAILDKMIYAIELTLKDEYWYVNNPNREIDEASVAEGMGLFHKYFHSLWD